MTQENMIIVINQFFEIEKKANNRNISIFERNTNRLKNTFEEMGFNVIIPINETYNETRTDLTAHITSSNNKKLVITEVIKPIIYYKDNGKFVLVQKGNVIVG